MENRTNPLLPPPQNDCVTSFRPPTSSTPCVSGNSWNSRGTPASNVSDSAQMLNFQMTGSSIADGPSTQIQSPVARMKVATSKMSPPVKSLKENFGHHSVPVYLGNNSMLENAPALPTSIEHTQGAHPGTQHHSTMTSSTQGAHPGTQHHSTMTSPTQGAHPGTQHHSTMTSPTQGAHPGTQHHSTMTSPTQKAGPRTDPTNTVPPTPHNANEGHLPSRKRVGLPGTSGYVTMPMKETVRNSESSKLCTSKSSGRADIRSHRWGMGPAQVQPNTDSNDQASGYMGCDLNLTEYDHHASSGPCAMAETSL